MAQKRRKTSIIVSFLCPVELLGQIDVAVLHQATHTLHVPLDRSSWIRRAIRRDLDHTRRSRRKGKSNVELEENTSESVTAPAPEGVGV